MTRLDAFYATVGEFYEALEELHFPRDLVAMEINLQLLALRSMQPRTFDDLLAAIRQAYQRRLVAIVRAMDGRE